MLLERPSPSEWGGEEGGRTGEGGADEGFAVRGGEREGGVGDHGVE